VKTEAHAEQSGTRRRTGRPTWQESWRSLRSGRTTAGGRGRRKSRRKRRRPHSPAGRPVLAGSVRLGRKAVSVRLCGSRWVVGVSPPTPSACARMRLRTGPRRTSSPAPVTLRIRPGQQVPARPGTLRPDTYMMRTTAGCRHIVLGDDISVFAQTGYSLALQLCTTAAR
jgi:hypothetical protein